MAVSLAVEAEIKQQLVEEHRLQVRLWFAGLPTCDQEELFDLLRQYPLLTCETLRSLANAPKPR